MTRQLFRRPTHSVSLGRHRSGSVTEPLAGASQRSSLWLTGSVSPRPAWSDGRCTADSASGHPSLHGGRRAASLARFPAIEEHSGRTSHSVCLRRLSRRPWFEMPCIVVAVDDCATERSAPCCSLQCFRRDTPEPVRSLHCFVRAIGFPNLERLSLPAVRKNEIALYRLAGCHRHV